MPFAYKNSFGAVKASIISSPPITTANDFLWEQQSKGSNKAILNYEFRKPVKVILR